jgi:hypothetical protein
MKYICKKFINHQIKKCLLFRCRDAVVIITEKRWYREETRGKLCHADIFSLLTIENYINSLFY